MLLGDTNEAAPVFTENEITALLALNRGDVFGAAADGCRAIVASSAKQAILFSTLAGELSVDQTKVPQYYLQLATKYDEQRGRMDTNDYRVNWYLKTDPWTGKDDTAYDPSEEEDLDRHMDQNYERTGN